MLTHEEMRYGLGLRRRRYSYRRRRANRSSRYSARRNRRTAFKRRRTFAKRFNRPSAIKVRQTLITDEAYVKLKYHTQQTLNTTGKYDNWVMTGNNMYDPDLTGVGHQPTGFDQYSAFYNKYLVYASKIKVTYQNNLSGTMSNLYLIPSDTAAPTWFGDANYDPADQPDVKSTIMQGYSINQGASNGVLKHFYTTKKIWEDKFLDQNDYGATTTSGPSKQWYWFIYNTVYQFNGGGISSNITFSTTLDIKVTYYAKFFDRKFQVES